MKTWVSTTDLSFVRRETTASENAFAETSACHDSLAEVMRMAILLEDADLPAVPYKSDAR